MRQKHTSHRNKTNDSFSDYTRSERGGHSPVEQLVVDVLGSVHVGTNAVDDLNQLLQLILQTLRGQQTNQRIKRESNITLQLIKSRAELSCTCPVLWFVSRNQALVPLGTSLLRRHNQQMAKTLTTNTFKMILILSNLLYSVCPLDCTLMQVYASVRRRLQVWSR